MPKFGDNQEIDYLRVIDQILEWGGMLPQRDTFNPHFLLLIRERTITLDYKVAIHLLIVQLKIPIELIPDPVVEHAIRQTRRVSRKTRRVSQNIQLTNEI